MQHSQTSDPSHTKGNGCGKNRSRSCPAPGRSDGEVSSITACRQLVKSLSQQEKEPQVGEGHMKQPNIPARAGTLIPSPPGSTMHPQTRPHLPPHASPHAHGKRPRGQAAPVLGH